MTLFLNRTLLCIIRNQSCKLCHKESTISSFNKPFKKEALYHMMSAQNGKVVFDGKSDVFNGVTVDSQVETCQVDLFANKLKESLEKWNADNRRTVWFKINIDDADCVPILAKNGFVYHHAVENYVMMYKWLPITENCNVPPYAHTMIGVGAVVINDKNELLVVSEKYFKVSQFKLPGGYVEPGENSVDAAIREVHEETGIQTEFESMIAFRQTHNSQFNCSDIYNLFSLKPLNLDITKSSQEIESCQWMRVQDYLEHPHVYHLNKFILETYLEYKKNNIKIDCVHGIHQILQKPYTMYHVVKS